MEVVPVVTQILYYTIGLLVIALITNYLMHKFKKEEVAESGTGEIRKLSEKEVEEKFKPNKTKSKNKNVQQNPLLDQKPTNPKHFNKKLEDYQKPSPSYVIRRKKSKLPDQKEFEKVKPQKAGKVLDFRTEFR